MNPSTFQRIRAKLGMTQTQLAAALRIEDIRTIRRWERGERAISGPVSLLMELLDDGRLLP